MAVVSRLDGIFVDTPGWYAMTDRGEHSHAAAVRRFRRATEQRRPILTTNHIFGESFTLTQSRLGPRTARELLARFHQSALVERVFVTEAWEAEAERLLVQYDDQRFSYVDATSFVTMRLLGLSEALTFDTDFVIAGFSLVGNA